MDNQWMDEGFSFERIKEKSSFVIVRDWKVDILSGDSILKKRIPDVYDNCYKVG